MVLLTSEVRALVRETIKSGKRRIRLASYSLPDAETLDLLERKHAAGADVKMIIEASRHEGGPLPDYCDIVSPPVGVLHAKYVVADDCFALGSFNFAGVPEPDAEVMVGDRNAVIAAQLCESFDRVLRWRLDKSAAAREITEDMTAAAAYAALYPSTFSRRLTQRVQRRGCLTPGERSAVMRGLNVNVWERAVERLTPKPPIDVVKKAAVLPSYSRKKS